MKQKQITKIIDNIRLDFRFKIDKKKIIDFAINVSVINEDQLEDVYRVDTKHGYLHEQRLWRDEGPRNIEDEHSSYTEAYHTKTKEVIANFQKWVKAYDEAKKNRTKSVKR